MQTFSCLQGEGGKYADGCGGPRQAPLQSGRFWEGHLQGPCIYPNSETTRDAGAHELEVFLQGRLVRLQVVTYGP